MKLAFAQLRDAKQERDKRRGYSIDKKRVAIAYAVELVIVAASLWGARLFAKMYGHDDVIQMQMMMLAPIGYAVIEFCRVPLAISARAHSSAFVRTVAILGVVCAAGVTVKSMSQLGQIMFQPRLYDVVHSKEKLQQAQDAQATVKKQIADADAQVRGRRTELDTLEQRAKSGAAQIAGLPKAQCAPAIWYKHGRQYKGQWCKTDSRIATLRDNLSKTTTDWNDAKQLWERAVAERNGLSRAEADHDVADAWVNYREALLHSQLHSFTGMLFGIGPTEVTDGQINRFLRLFVFLPAIFVAFASTFIAFTAVHHLKPELVPFEPEGTDYLLNPFYTKVVDDAIDRLHAKHKADAEKIGETA